MPGASSKGYYAEWKEWVNDTMAVQFNEWLTYDYC